MKSLLIGNANCSIDSIAAAQLEPFFRHRKELQRRLDLTFEHIQASSISEIEPVCQTIASEIEILFIRPDWRDEAQQVVLATKAIRERNPDRQIIFIDPWDQVSSRFFGVLPYVDRLVKYQRLKNLQDYHRPLLGGTVITDYLTREWNCKLNGWHVGSEVPRGYEHRIVTGWNVVTASRFEAVLFRSALWRLKNRQLWRRQKDIALCCHLSYDAIDEESWYTSYRKVCVATAKRLEPKYKLAVSGEHPEARTISSRQYHRDMQRSRIAFSPFGWGETTWRDYEAVCNDCLLLKPDVAHVETSPNIYYPGKTYVPLKWDSSDLEEKCDYYLRNPDEAAQMVVNARRILERYFKQAEFVQTIAGLVGIEETHIPNNGKTVSTITSPTV